MREIDELIALCRYGGSSVALGQGAGGNASVKGFTERVMWIKASGYRLSAVGEGQGYLRMRIPTTEEMEKAVCGLDCDAANNAISNLMRSQLLDSTVLRPSMETWFHVVLGRVVLHTHPIYANAFSCMEGGEAILENLLKSAPAFVEYRTPGHLLGQAVQRASDSYCAESGRQVRQMLLANHGLITSSETIDEAIAATSEVLLAGQRFFGPVDEHDFAVQRPRASLTAWAADLERTYAEHTGRRVVARAARFRALQSVHSELPNPLVPDDVVCNGESVLETEGTAPAGEFVARHSESLSFSAAIAVHGHGFVFLAPGSGMIDAMEEQLLANVVLRKLIRAQGQCRPLSPSEIAPLLSMEQEKHRRSVLAHADGGPSCR